MLPSPDDDPPEPSRSAELLVGHRGARRYLAGVGRDQREPIGDLQSAISGAFDIAKKRLKTHRDKAKAG